jgi:hypothetical protein
MQEAITLATMMAAMNEIEIFLEECANDPYFRVHPEKLDVILATIDELSRADDRDALASLARAREIAARTDRTPRQRCKELFSELVRALKHQDQSRNDEFNKTGAQDYQVPASNRDSEIFAATRSLVEAFWILQGRVKAVELIAVEVVKAIARSHVDPECYVKQFVERARMQQMVLVSEETERLVRERETAFEEILTAIYDVAITAGQSDDSRRV